MDKDDPFQRPIQPMSGNDRERLTVSEIEAMRDALRKESEKPYDMLRTQKKGSLVAILSFLKTLFTKGASAKYESAFASEKDDILFDDITQLQTLLQTLSEKDRSEDPAFANKLSDIWCMLSFHAEALEKKRMKSAIPPKKIRHLVKEIGNYPAEAEHNFGYYLLHHAGKDWLPFPFMELLRRLHREYALDGRKSHLSQWLTLIDALLSGEKR